MNHPNRFTVIAALVDEHFLRLYKEDGSEYNIPQGDPRLKPVLDMCLANLKKEGDRVVVDVSEANHYADYEQKSGGLVKLFRVAKSKVAEFFGKTEAVVEPAKPIVLGKVPGRNTPTVTAVVTKKAEFVPTQEEKLASAVDEILSHATPVSDKAFQAPERMPEPKKYQTVPDAFSGDTMIAVVNGQVIPGVEQLKTQIAHASVMGSKGFNAFMERLSGVMAKRRHSVEDLLKFLEKGDLPIADDGCIVAYKRLKTSGGRIVDVHSGNVVQDVGSFVHMDESMVDHDRRQDCSHGLHIARRGYLSGFSGDVTVICKIRPEDVIAVPEYDANKVRVCGYHIVAKLTKEQAAKVCSNQAMTDDDSGKILLGKVLAGEHIGITQYVKIGGNKGTNLTITPAMDMEGAVSVALSAAKTYVENTATPRKAEAISDAGVVAPAVDVKEVAAQVTIAKDKEKGVHKPTQKEIALDLLSQVTEALLLGAKEAAAVKLIAFKKSSKKSWGALGITEAQAKSVQEIAKDKLPQKGAIFTNEKTLAKAQKAIVPKAAKRAANIASAKGSVEAQGLPEPKARKPRSDKGTSVGQPVPGDEVKPLVAAALNDGVVAKARSPREQLTELLRQPPTTESAKQMVEIKKKAKKGWDALGVTPSELSVILKLAGK